MTIDKGQFISTRFVPAHCDWCGLTTEHARNEFTRAIFYVFQICGSGSVAWRIRRCRK